MVNPLRGTALSTANDLIRAFRSPTMRARLATLVTNRRLLSAQERRLLVHRLQEIARRATEYAHLLVTDAPPAKPALDIDGEDLTM